MPITQSENDPMHKADENMVWFASYRDCRCTFVGDSLQAVPATRPHLTVTQERNATDTAINELRIAEAYDRPLHMGPFVASLILKRLDRLQMLASGYSEATSKYESLVGDLLKMLDNDDLDGARDIVKREYEAIHGPND